MMMLWIGCDKEIFLPIETTQESELIFKANDHTKSFWATGELYVNYFAKKKDENHQIGEEGNESKMTDEVKRAIVYFNAHEASKNKDPKGEVLIHMADQNGNIKREIMSDVFEVYIDPEINEAWFLALVIADTKTTIDDKAHGDGCGSEDHDPSDGTEHLAEIPEDHTSNKINGSTSRVGQILVVNVLDGGSPGTNGDSISWKWFKAESPKLQQINEGDQWPTLCEKLIIGGNLVVHTK